LLKWPSNKEVRSQRQPRKRRKRRPKSQKLRKRALRTETTAIKNHLPRRK